MPASAYALLARTCMRCPDITRGSIIVARLPAVPLAGLLTATVLAACSSSHAPDPSPDPIGNTISPSPTGSRTPSPSPTTADIDVSTVPDEITVDYLQEVMEALDMRVRDAYTDLQSTGDVDEEFVGTMRLLYTNGAAEPQIASLRSDGDIGVDGIASDPLPPRTDVREVFAVADDCVFFSAERTYEPLLAIEYDPVQPYYIALVRSDPNDTNPTAWSIGFETFYPDPAAPAPENPCG